MRLAQQAGLSKEASPSSQQEPGRACQDPQECDSRPCGLCKNILVSLPGFGTCQGSVLGSL